MPERKEKSEAGLEAENRALQDRLAEVEEQLKLLKFSADEVKSRQANDYKSRWERAQEIRRKSMDPGPGSIKWIVHIPGCLEPVWFMSDTTNEHAAIHEYEQRFGTRFITNNQREEDNHRIEKASA